MSAPAAGLVRAAGFAAVLTLAAGCSAATAYPPRPSPEFLPAGSPLLDYHLSDGDAWLRHHLMFGEPRLALTMLADPETPVGDRLVRALQEGLVLHHAGDYEESNDLLEWAEREADLRYTRSVSRAVGSITLSDRSLAYVPPASEMGMIPFYRMLNYLALGDLDGALVESRKANALLARLDRQGADSCDGDAMLLYMAGMVQSAGGERNDALVSLRQAEAAYDSCGADAAVSAPPQFGMDLYRAARASGIRELADSIASRYDISGPLADESGDLMIVLEEGFVAYRTPEALHIPIYPDEVDGLEDDGNEEDLDDVAVRIAERLSHDDSGLDGCCGPGYGWGGGRGGDGQWSQWGHAAAGAYVMRLSWPALRSDSRAPAEVRVFVDDSLAAVARVSDLSDQAERDMAAGRPAMLARLVARGLTKYLVTRGIEQKAEEEGGEVAGFIAGALTNMAANGLEQADTRSWSLLPHRVSIARLRLPAGEHAVRIESVAASGEVIEARELGVVSIRAGELVALSERVWNTRHAGESRQDESIITSRSRE
jgi:hypothetical protein